MHRYCLLILILLTGCKFSPCEFEPCITYVPPQKLVECRPSAFEKLTKEELRQEWGKELYAGLNFANEMDLYRAITCFKKALYFLPPSNMSRKMQIEYSIFQCYYLGLKYSDAAEFFDKSSLEGASVDFPPFEDLLIMLIDCYQQTCQYEKAERVYNLLRSCHPETADTLLLSFALEKGNIPCVETLGGELTEPLLNHYCCYYKSPQRARVLNGILPGAGYYYVGQKKAALTSLIVNSLFTAAAYYCFANHNIPAGVILTSLETGWYIGGMNGAGLAANEYNERLYEVNAKEVMIENRLFPVLMLGTSF